MGRCYHSVGLFMSFTRNPALSGSQTHDLDKGDGGLNNERAQGSRLSTILSAVVYVELFAWLTRNKG